MTYAKCKSIKGPYLEQYKLCGASSSRTVFDEENQGKVIDEIKDREIALRVQKEDVLDAIAKKKESLPDDMDSNVKQKKKEALDNQKEVAFAKLDNDIEKLKTAKAKVKDTADNKWDQEKRKLDELSEKIKKAEDGFVMGGSFKAKWDNELKEAKLDIDQEVTEKAREIVTTRGDKEAAKEFDAKLAKLKQRAAEAEEAAADAELDADEEAATKAMAQIPSLPAYQQAKDDLDGFCSELDKAYRPEAEKEKEKEKTQESEKVLEGDAPKAPSPSEVIALMSKAYSNQPDDAKPEFASKVISNIEKIRDLKVKIAEVRLKAAEETEKAASGDEKIPSAIKKAFLQDGKIPDNFKEDVKDSAVAYKDELAEWKDKTKDEGKGGEEEGKEDGKEEKGKGDEQSPANDEKPDNTEKIAQLDSKIEGLKKDKKTKSDKLNSLNHPDVLAVEVAIKSSELQKAELGDDKDAIKSAEAALKTAQDDKKEAVKKEGKGDSSGEKKDSGAEESLETGIPKKFMKFEDFLNMKVKNK